MALKEETTMTYDEIIGGCAIAPLTANITISAAAAKVAKGAVLTAEGAVADGSAVAKYVLAADIAQGDTVATVYTAGQFNREKLTVAAGTVEVHEEQLRAVGIYLTSLK